MGGFALKSFTIYLFRHGLTKGNLNAQYIGHTDLPITTDSISALKNIKARHHYPEVEAVFVSPLRRCAESAAIMFPKNKPLVINELIEHGYNIRRNGISNYTLMKNSRIIFIGKIPDNTDDIKSTKDIPSWKRMCYCILKNDHICRFMGFGLTRQQQQNVKALKEKYRGIDELDKKE